MDKVSIIVPVYNTEKYVERCIESIISQTYSKMEVILINDGSDDSSGKICMEYAHRDKRIIYLSQENAGQGRARNRGLDIMSGEYVLFIDSDDYIHPQMVEFMLKAAQQRKADFVQCKYVEVDTSDVTYFENYNNELLKSKIQDEEDTDERLLCYYTDDVMPVNKLIRKELLNGMRFPEGIFYEDKHLMFRIRHIAKKIVYVNIPFYYYVQSPSSTMRNAWDEKRILSRFCVGEDLLQYCRDNHLQKNYMSELSGYFRTLLSIYFTTSEEEQWNNYAEKAKSTLQSYLPELKENPYMVGKYKMMCRMLCYNINSLELLKVINGVYKRLRK